MTHLTTEEAERMWYCLGWPAPQRAEDLDDALECQQWRDVADTHCIDGPGELGDRLIAAQKFENALYELTTSDAVPDALAAVIADYLKKPEAFNLPMALRALV